MVPVTSGEAMLVPLSARYGSVAVAMLPHGRAPAFVRYSVVVGSVSDSMSTPGATTSGFAVKSIALGPRELNAATASSARAAVPISLDAPTVSTQGAFPGAPTPPYSALPAGLRPRLPAAETTTMPASTARFAASVRGSVLYDSYTPAATERLMTRMWRVS